MGVRGVAVFVCSLLFSLFRTFVNKIDPYLRRINIRLVTMPPSSVEELLATVRADSGSLPSLAHNSQWRKRLQLALDRICTADDATPFGRWFLYVQLRKEINSLQCTEAIAQKFPEVVIAPHGSRSNRPIFIIGLWRSGTTLLQRLLSLYPDVFSPTPALFDVGEISLSDVKKATSLVDLRQRIKKAMKTHAFVFDVTLQWAVSCPYQIHPAYVNAAEECLWGLNRYLWYETLPIIRSNDFMNVAVQCEELSDRAYRLYERDLHVYQSILSSNQDSRSRFVLKAAHHTPFVDAIRRHFPNALFVRMHRNPAEVVPSSSSFLRRYNAAMMFDIDLSKLGESVTESVCSVAKELVRQTPQMPEDTIDVQFEEFSRDPVFVCKRIAIQAGMKQTKEMDAKLLAFMNKDNAQRDKAGKHEYALEEFGLDAEKIRSDCKEYCDMFAV